MLLVMFRPLLIRVFGISSFGTISDNRAMQLHTSGSRKCLALWGIVLAFAPFWLQGCASRMLKASKLPPQFAAPAPSDNDILNLAGLSNNNSISVDVVQPGDVLDVSMVNDYSKLTTSTTPLRVADDGMIIVPLVGKVSVGGMEVERAEQAINAEAIARGIFRNPSVTVVMKQCRTRKVAIVGAVKKPGTYQLPRGASSLMAALVAADGLTSEADLVVEIRHTDSRQAYRNSPNNSQMAAGPNGNVALASFQQTQPGVMSPAVTSVDLRAAAAGAVQVPDLFDGDVVNVTKRKLPPVYVIGLVRKPGEFPFPANQELRVLDAIALAGGVSNAFSEEIVVIRKVKDAKEPVRIAVSIQAAKSGSDNIALAPGDTVSIEQTPATMALDVVNSFFRVNVGGSFSWF